MRRRELIVASIAAALGAPLATRAQAARSRPLIGFLSNGSPGSPARKWFLDAMEGQGYVDGKTFDLAGRYSGEGNDDRLPALAAELVTLNPDLIFATSSSCAVAASKATASIPIVVALMQDPVGSGLALSEARPGRNVTGLLSGMPGLHAKQVEFATALIPTLRRLGLIDIAVSVSTEPDEIKAAVRERGIAIVAAAVASEGGLDEAMRQLAAQQAQAVIVIEGTLMFTARAKVSALALDYHLPAFFSWPDAAFAGALLGYGVDVRANFQRAVTYVARILDGAKPADIPFEFPTKLSMALNLKTAKTLGITMPQSLLVQADQVIE